jgi:hypothetical protein
MPHAYVFYIVEQNGPINATAFAGYENSRVFFDGLAFIHQANLGAIVGVSFAQVFTDLTANFWFNQFGMPLPCPAQTLAAARANAADWLLIDVPPSVTMMAQMVWASPASSYTVCNMTSMSPRSVVAATPSMGRSGASATTGTTRTPPFIFVAADPSKLYTVIVRDLEDGALFYMAVNVPGDRAQTGVIGAGDRVVGYFSPVNPNGFAHSLVVRVWEQTSTINATMASQTVLAQPTARMINMTSSPIGSTVVVNFTSASMMAVAAALPLGPTVAYNWVNAFTSAFSLAAFNEYGIGTLYGNMTCPMAVTQATMGNATWAGTVMPTTGSGSASLATPLDVTFYTPATSMRTRAGNTTTPMATNTIYNGPINDFGGAAYLPSTSGWLAPIVAAPYVNTSANYTLVMVRQMPYSASMQGAMQGGAVSVLWVVANIAGAGLPTGNLGQSDTVWPYSGVSGAPGIVSTWLFSQGAAGPTDATGITVSPMGVTMNMTQFMMLRTLRDATAMSFFSAVPAVSGASCLAADGVQLSSDGRCVTDCVALLRIRRACQTCGTVAVPFRLGRVVAGANAAQITAAVTSAVAAYLGVTPGSLAVSTNGTAVSIILPQSMSPQLQTAVASGSISVTIGTDVVPLANAPGSASLAPVSFAPVSIAPVTAAPIPANSPTAGGTLPPASPAPVTTAPTTLAPVTFVPAPTTAPTSSTASPVPTAPTSPTARPISTPTASPTMAPTSVAPTPISRNSADGSTSSSKGLGSGAIAGIVIVVIVCIGVAVYFVLVAVGVASKPFGGGNGKSASNPYGGGAPAFHGGQPSGTNVVSNPTYEQAMPGNAGSVA